MSAEVNLGIAFLAGVISFASPCVLPLLPGYLSYITGVSVKDIQEGGKVSTWTLLFPTLLFVAGFSIVFVLLGSAIGAAGNFLLEYKPTIEKVAGILIILMGILLTGFIKVPTLYKEIKFLPKERRFGVLGALPLGMAFAIGWTPCVGPILGSILNLAITDPSASVPLLSAYSAGLGIPFILSGVLFGRLTTAFDWFKRRGQIINAVSGVLLVLIGILLVSGRWNQVMAPLQGLFQLPI